MRNLLNTGGVLYYASLYGEKGLQFVAEATVEEFLEMVGIATFVYALLEYMRLYVEEFTLPPAGKKLP